MNKVLAILLLAAAVIMWLTVAAGGGLVGWILAPICAVLGVAFLLSPGKKQ